MLKVNVNVNFKDAGVDLLYPTVYSANKLNQLIGRFWFPTPMRWDSDNLRWHYKSKCVVPYLLATLAYKLGLSLWCGFAFTYGFENPGTVSTMQLITLPLDIMLMGCFTITDLITCYDGKILAICTNCCYQKDAWIRRFGRPRFHQVCHALANGTVVGTVAAAAVFAVFAVQAELDPFVALPSLAGQNLFAGMGRVVRFVISVYLAEIAVVSFRTLFITGVLEALYRVEMLLALTKRLPIRSNIAVYRENLLLARIIHPYEYKLMAAAFIVIFIFFLFGVNVAIEAGMHNETKLLVISCIVTVAAIITLHALFVTGCSTYELSTSVLHRWSRKVHSVHNRKEALELKRILRSLQKIQTPVGDVGIIDNDMKINYTEKMLGYLVDSILARNSLN